MRNRLLYLILIANIFQIACSQNKESISVEQIPSNYSTILRADLDKKNILSVRFYLEFNITNNTNEEINVSFPEYIYNKKYTRDSYLGWVKSIPIYSNQNDTLEHIFSNKEIIGLEKLENKPKRYVFLTAHEPKQDSLAQSLFSIYLEKMKSENKDTLHIGTISELKAKNSPILKMLEGDSLILSFGRNDIYLDPIPVQIK